MSAEYEVCLLSRVRSQSEQSSAPGVVNSAGELMYKVAILRKGIKNA